MKTTKRFLLTLAAMIGMTGAWAQDTPEEVTVTATANAASDWSTTVPTAIASGTYYVWYKVLGDDTHEGLIATSPLTVHVAQTTAALLAVTGSTGTT